MHLLPHELLPMGMSREASLELLVHALVICQVGPRSCAARLNDFMAAYSSKLGISQSIVTFADIAQGTYEDSTANRLIQLCQELFARDIRSDAPEWVIVHCCAESASVHL